MTQFTSPTRLMMISRPASSSWCPRPPLTPKGTSCTVPDWSRSLPGLGRWRWLTLHRAGSSVKPSREAGAGEPLAEALEATVASVAGRLHFVVGPPAGSRISKKWASEENVKSEKIFFYINYVKMVKVMSSDIYIYFLFLNQLPCNLPFKRHKLKNNK